MAQGSDQHKPSSFDLGRGILRLAWRYWAPAAIAVFTLLAGWTGYQMWRADFPAAMTKLPWLALYLLLIVVVLLVKYALKHYARSAIRKGKASLQKKVAQEVAQEGLSRARDVVEKGVERAEDALEKGVAEAKQVVTSLGREAQDSWGGLTSGQKASTPSTQPCALRCSACGATIRPGARFCAKCGATLSPTCPKCGRKLRPGARFCDGCGEVVRPDS